MVNGGSDGAAVALDVVDSDKNDTKKRRFLRGLRRMFRRRGHRDASDGSRDNNGAPEPREPPAHTPNTQRLLEIEDAHRRKSSSVHQSGLSVSHDSVFTAEASEASGGESDEERARSSSSTSERRRRHHHHHHHHNHHGGGTPLNAELAAAVRRRARGDTSEEDEDLGLPRSPPASPPKRGNVVNGGSGVREQSSCSEGSLLSAGSSQSEDDCRSSRGDLTHSTFDGSDVDGQESLGGLAPLSHSAAKHKMAIKPRRTHGAPRRNRPKQISPSSVLPTTPEVNEEVARSVTPEVNVTHKSTDITMMSTSTPSERHNIMITSNYEVTEAVLHSDKTTDYLPGHVSKDTRLKSSSLPPGLALSQMMGQAGSSPMKLSVSSSEELGNSVKVSRSKSNAQNSESDNRKVGSELQASSERNISTFSSLKNYGGSIDIKYTSPVSGDLQKRFGSVSEDEELLNSGYYENGKPDLRNKRYCDKTEKTDKHNDTHLHEILNKNKQSDIDDHNEKHSNKKEESFFNRLLLRKSGKKGKKETSDKEEQSDVFVKYLMRDQHPIKSASSDQIAIGKSINDHGIVRQQKMMCSDQHSHKSIGQTVFSNQSHKRIDTHGGYALDPMTKSSIEFGTKESNYFVDREFSKSKEDINARRLSSESVNKGHQPKLRQRVEPLDIPVSPDQVKKPPLLPRMSPHEQKSHFPLINQGKVYPAKDVVNGGRYTKNTSKQFSYSDENSQTASPKVRNKSEGSFSIGQVVKQTESLVRPLSYSVSPPKSVWPQSYSASPDFKSGSQGSLEAQGMKHSKSDYNTRYFDYPTQMRQDYDVESSKSKPKIAGLSSYQQKITQIGNMDNDSEISFTDSGSLRNPVLKSHSFRHNSDVTPMATHDNMPSLPPIYGISETSIDSWESTYKKNLRDVTDGPSSLELGSDSLMNYPYKNDLNRSYTETGVFVVPNVLDLKEDLLNVNDLILDSTKSIKAQDDISRIEANIDSIIGNPKPLTCVALKSSSLDSVKSINERSEGRKAYSNESISNNKIYLNQPAVPDIVGSVSFSAKHSPDSNNRAIPEAPRSKSSIDLSFTGTQPPESHVSVTMFNSRNSNIVMPPLKTPELLKVTTQHFDFTSNGDKYSQKQPQHEERDTKIIGKSHTTSNVPEFMKIQLNKVDQKPATNVVLTTGGSNDTKSKPARIEKVESFTATSQLMMKRPESFERSVSYEPKRSDMFMFDIGKMGSSEKIIFEDPNESFKPHRKFSSEDVEILEKSDMNIQNNQYNIGIRKTGSQSLLNKSSEMINVDNFSANIPKSEDKTGISASVTLRKSPSSVSNLPPPSPTANKNFMKKKSGAFDFIETNNDVNKRQSTPILSVELRSGELSSIEKNSVAQTVKRMSSHELLGVDHNPRIDRSSSSSDDCNLESTVVLRKKSISSIGQRSSTPKDDEPELMKVFARRSLKLKDSETESITQDIMKLANIDHENNENVSTDNSKRNSKQDYNVLTRSRDSDKENETDSPKDERKKSIHNDVNKNGIEYRKHNETAELMQAQRIPKKILDINPVSVNNASNVQLPKSTPLMSYTGYQRCVSTNIPLINPVSVTNKTEPTKTITEVTNNKLDVVNYKKDVSDSSPEKRLRNRTFPDSSTQNKVDDSIKAGGTKNDQFSVGTSSLPKKPWNQMRTEESFNTKDILKPLRKSSYGVITPEAKPIAANNKTVLEKFPINKSISEKNVPLMGNKSFMSDKNVIAKNYTEKEASPNNTQDSEENKTDSSTLSEPIHIDNNKNANETDGSPQFRGILQMRAEWERRAQQAMTK